MESRANVKTDGVVSTVMVRPSLYASVMCGLIYVTSLPERQRVQRFPSSGRDTFK